VRLVKYKIIQLDAGFEHLVALAKKQCTKLFVTGAEGFDHAWNQGDAVIRIRGNVVFDEAIARIWISGVKATGHYYNGLAPLPCAGRTLGILVGKPVQPTPPTYPPIEYRNYIADGPVISGGSDGSGNGVTISTWTFVDSDGNSAGGGSTTSTYVAFVLVGTVSSNAPVFGIGSSMVDPHDFSRWMTSNGAGVVYHVCAIADHYNNVSVPAYYTALAAYNVALPAYIAAAKTDVVLSDGTVLATMPYTENIDGSTVNYPDVTAWAGSNWVQLFNKSNTDVYSLGTLLTFTVPPDVVMPTSTKPPGYPGEPNPNVTRSADVVVVVDYPLYAPDSPFKSTVTSFNWRVNAVVVAAGSITVLEKYGSTESAAHTWSTSYTLYPSDIYGFTVSKAFGGTESAPAALLQYVNALGTNSATVLQWNRDWATAIGVARVRERARRKLCSDSVLALPTPAYMPLTVRKELRKNHFKSTGTYMPTLMSASVVTNTTGGGNDTLVTKVVALTFSVLEPPLPTPTVYSQVVSGSRHTVITLLADSIGNADVSSYTTVTYVSWLDIDVASGKLISPAIGDYAFMHDTEFGLCQIADGVVVQGAADFISTRDTYGFSYVPPKLQSSDSRVYTYPPLYRTYRAAVERVYAVGLGNQNWLDSVLVDDEHVDVFPMSTMHSLYGDLGMFPHALDVAFSTAVSENPAYLTLKADRKATYAYSYQTGLMALTGYVLFDGSAIDAKTFRHLPVILPFMPALNIVFRARQKNAWGDVAAQTAAQATDISSNPSAGHNQIYQALAGL